MARRIAWLAVTLLAAAPAGCKKQQAQARPAGPTAAPPAPTAAEGPAQKAPVGHFRTARNATDGNTQRVLSRLAEQAQRQERLVDGPWTGASVGQWARYRSGGTNPMLLTKKVVAVHADTVTLEVTVGEGMVSTQQLPLRVPAGAGDLELAYLSDGIVAESNRLKNATYQKAYADKNTDAEITESLQKLKTLIKTY